MYRLISGPSTVKLPNLSAELRVLRPLPGERRAGLSASPTEPMWRRRASQYYGFRVESDRPGGNAGNKHPNGHESVGIAGEFGWSG